MSNILLSDEITVFLFIEGIILSLLFIAFINSIFILKSWDFYSTSAKQLKLQKRSYLVILIIVVSLIVKVFALPYFAYVLDDLSHLIPGAMCGAGVIGANIYGEYLLPFKVLILFIIGIWLILNNQDFKTKNHSFVKDKFIVFILLFLLICVEFSLSIAYLSNISTEGVLSSCSLIYGARDGDSILPFGLDILKLIILFYFIYLLSILANFKKQAFLSFVSNALFLYIGYFAIVHFFASYIYELSTHNCPFCMLQSEYYYVGYFILTSLFLGTFFGIASFVLKLFIKKDIKSLYGYSNFFNLVFISLCTFYLISFYLKNGVLL